MQMQQLFTVLIIAAIFGLVGIDFQLAGLLHRQLGGAVDVTSMLGP